MIVRLPLEPSTEEFKPGRFHAILTCSAKRFGGRPVWIDSDVYLNEEAALADAEQMLRWLERQTWMGGDGS